MLWERCSCTDVGHLSVSQRLSVNVIEVKVNANVVGSQLLLCSHDWFK
jgi:hypothetical protein